MTTQRRNDQRDELLAARFLAKNDPGVAWSRAVSSMIFLPECRGVWGMGSVDENGAVYDMSGQGRTLTNVSALQRGVYNALAPYAIHDGVADILRRNNEPGIQITGALTVMGWFYSDDAPGITEGVFSKWDITGNQRAYELILSTTPNFHFVVSSDGTATTTVISLVTYLAARWFHVAGVYVPSTSLTIYVNGTATINTTSIPASIFNSTANLEIGANNAGTRVLDGRSALCGLYAASHAAATIRSVYHSQRALFSRV